MPGHDRPFQPRDIALALALLTRLPVRVSAGFAAARGARAAWAYPLAGAVVALLAGGLGWLALAAGIAPPLAAGLVLATQVVLTGAMHEDGLADCADGFWGGWEPARRLEIMRDSRVGTYGVIALVLSLGLRGAALTALAPVLLLVLVASAMLSRLAMVLVMGALPPARPGGLSSGVGQPRRGTAAMGTALAALFSLALLGAAAPALWLAALLAGLVAGLVARAKIGGQTGDVLGATQQLAEIACLCAATLWMA